MSGGWIKVHRALADHEIWQARPFTIGQAWIDLLLRANYHESTAMRGLKSITVHRGQVLTSVASLGTAWGTDRKTVRRWLRAFQEDGMLDGVIRHGGDGGYTLLTIRNYEKYQGLPEETGDGAHSGDGDGQRDGRRAFGRDFDRDGQRPISKKEEEQEGEDVSTRARANGHQGPIEVELPQ